MADEYIRKADAVDYCKALMNAEVVQNTDDWGYGKERYNQTEVILEFIENRPPADVVQVVRCKDCRKRRKDGHCTMFQNSIHGIATSWYMPQDDDFCSYGEKRGEE